MILEFKVKNYLSIRDEQTLSFEATSDKTLGEHFVVRKGKKRLLKMALIFGANASGKTNVLLALNYLRNVVLNHTIGKTDTTGHIPFLLDDSSRNTNGIFDLSFFIDDILYEYHLEINHRFINNEKLSFYPGIKPAVVFNRNYNKDKDLTMIEYGSLFKLKATDKSLIQGNAISNMSVLAAYSKLNIDFPELDKVYKYFLYHIAEIITPRTDLLKWTSEQVDESEKTKKFVLDLLNNADFNISGINIEEQEKQINEKIRDAIINSPLPETQKKNLLLEDKFKVKTLSFSHKGENDKEIEFPAEMESAGTNRFFGLSGALFHVLQNNKLLLIDEIDSSLHPELVIHFINTFLVNSKEAQLICTTHDLNILSEQDNLRKDVIWFTQKSKTGATELFSLADFKHRKELSFINAYKAGKFGAKPNLGSIYLKNI